jgi:signal transduction histidine kinase
VEYVQPVRRLWSLVRGHGLDVLIALLALEAMVEVSVRHGSNDATDLTLWLAVPAIAVFVVPLFLRGRYPFGGPATYWVMGAAFSFADGKLLTSMTSVFVLGMAAAYLLGNLNDAFRARVGLGVVVGCAALIVYNAPDHSTSEVVFIPLLFGICWLSGFALRERAEQAEAAEVRAAQAEREHEAAARVAVAEERARIARELHDIVAHAVSVMVLQVGAVRHNLPDELEADSEALQGVETTGRNALAEMRRLLGAMRREGDDLELAPQPGLDGLRALADEVGRAGLPVRLHVEGDPFPLPRAIDLSAYRIVQEGLTNALKHAGASAADVTVRYAPEELLLEVRDDGRGRAASDGLGHGLVGVRERVKIYGGEMAAGTANGGGFVLSTRLPLAGVRA